MGNSNLKIITLVSLLFIFEILSLVVTLLIHAAEPSSTNYKIQEYSFGAGGTTNSTSTNYKLNGIAGEVEFGKQTSANFGNGGGLTYLMKANVPPAPTLTNPSNYYNKLQLQLNTGGNPTDAQFALAIQNSSDSYATTKYVQADGTLGNTAVWQTNTLWGATGFSIIGLTPGLTYRARVAARQGNFTQSEYGPTAQVATVNSSFSFALNTNSVNFTSLTPGTVFTSNNITTTVDTNGTGGAIIYASDNNNGLFSSSTNTNINAISSDLGSTSQGYGLIDNTVSQTSGGPMQKLSPYNGTADNVGLLDTTQRTIFDSSSQPVTNGQGVFNLKAKASNTTKAASDYVDIITVIGSVTF